MTNDNIHVTNTQMAEASTVPFDIDEFFDADGNLIPFETETFEQDEADTKVETVDVANTR